MSVSDQQNPLHRRRKKLDDDLSVPELIEFVRAYVKQETVDPLRGVGRWIAFGAAGAFCLGLGLVIVLLGVLRLIEEEWDGSVERVAVVGRLPDHAARRRRRCSCSR